MIQQLTHRAVSQVTNAGWINKLVVILIAASALFWLYGALRVVGPIIMADEYAYLIGGLTIDHLDRLRAAAPTVPVFGNSVFLRIIQAISIANLPVGFTVKLINVAAVTGSTWILSHRILKAEVSWRALFLVGVIAFYPVGSYAAYLMPESLYLLAFSALMVILLASPDTKLISIWTLAGAQFGLMSLLKPHGLFALAAFIAATFAWCMVSRRVSLAQAALLGAAHLAAYAVVSLGLGQFVAPPAASTGASFVGVFYGDMVRSALAQWKAIGQTLDYGTLYASALVMLFGPSIAYLFRSIVAERTSPRGEGDLLSFSAFFLLFLIGIILSVISVLLSGLPPESNRVHLRYFSFLFPSLLALAFIWAGRRPELDTQRFRLFATALWVLGAGVFLIRLPALRPLAIDAPELFFTYPGVEFGSFGLGPFVRPFTGAVVGAGAIAILSRRVRWQDAQLLVLAIILAVSGLNTVIWQGRWGTLQSGPRSVGEVAQRICSPQPGAIVAMGTAENFVPLYTPMAAIDHLVPLSLVKPNEFLARARMLEPGSCLLTTSSADEALGSALLSRGGVSLYRVDVVVK